MWATRERLMSSLTFAKSARLFFHSWPQGAHLGNLLLLAPGSALICQDWGEDMGEDIACPQTVSAHMFFQSALARLMQYFIFHQINPLLKCAELNSYSSTWGFKVDFFFVCHKLRLGLDGLCENLLQFEPNFVQVNHVKHYVSCNINILINSVALLHVTFKCFLNESCSRSSLWFFLENNKKLKIKLESNCLELLDTFIYFFTNGFDLCHL